jgi:hypothetical protein
VCLLYVYYNRNDQKTMICGTRARALVRYLPGPRELGSELVFVGYEAYWGLA